MIDPLEFDHQALADAGFAVKQFPEELLSTSDRLPGDEVIALWTEFLDDGRLIFGGGQFQQTNCSDGRGVIVFGEAVVGAGPGTAFSWELRRSPADRWNSVTLAMLLDDPSIAELGVTTTADGTQLAPLKVEDGVPILDTRVVPNAPIDVDFRTIVLEDSACS